MASSSPKREESLRKLGLSDLKDLSGKRVIVRVDFNVPLHKTTGAITNNQRIVETLPTINYILEHGASCVLLSHLGRPDGRRQPSMSLRVVANELNRLLASNPHKKGDVIFVEEGVSSSAVETCSRLTAGQVVLLENLRFDVAEEGSGLDEAGNKTKASAEHVDHFRTLLTQLGDVFVNDAFGTAHRAHSSMVGIKHEQRAAGFLMKKELDYFARALENPRRPFLAILGGAKVTDKIKLINNLLDKVDAMIIGGGMAFTFKKVQGVEIGGSLFDEAGASLVPGIIEKAQRNNVKLYLPIDYTTADKFSNEATIGQADDETGIATGLLGLDVGPKSQQLFASVVRESKTIIWNGPMGVFEFSNFKQGTLAVFQAVAELSARDSTAVTIIGGGDTATAALEMGFMDKVSHVSTGGGASLELLEGRVLPGVSALSPALTSAL